ncbi:hypothetical protein KIN20_021249 [Parelaphostrongylus tenuis]|uniref:SGNH hydrolase-type esterase domain-containing protein n=1 Tax=Parelaphostrongylus tenuis TaxID=148309 RepID=A0AAD5N517_PARTN|nr:hypothetical protein KIN20_021249 [Parelaphostrongylus tenuis]
MIKNKARDAYQFLRYVCSFDFTEHHIGCWIPKWLKQRSGNGISMHEAGQYTVHLSITSDQGDVISVGSRTYNGRILWVAIIGDSFASGEGNPDVSKHGDKEAQWIDDRCHRSSKSFASTVFTEIAAVTPTYLTFLACTGATIDNGILKASGHDSQLDTLEIIATKRGRGPDIVILTTGGNDIGFSDIINTLVHDSARFDVSLIDMRFFFVSHQLDLVAKRLTALGAKNVFVPQYFDFTKNQHGEVDANCIASKERGSIHHVNKDRRWLSKRTAAGYAAGNG